MFPITLESKDGSIVTAEPPCYGFLRDEEWFSWSQRFHKKSYAIKMVRRPVRYMYEKPNEDVPLGNNVDSSCWEGGEDLLPISVMDLSDLVAIWNSGCRVPKQIYLDIKDDPIAFKYADGNGYDFSYDLKDLEKPDSTIDDFNMRHQGLFVTVKQVMTDLESALDKGRPSCLLWNEELDIMGVNTVDTPCDRALFYLMVNRELDDFGLNQRALTFLELHYVQNIPIVLAFLISRLVSISDKGEVFFSGQNGDSCIIPTQNLWVGMGKRFLEPVAIDWTQHSYNTGKGHYRDDDMEGYCMDPDISGFSSCYDDFNNTMFCAIIGGFVNNKTSTLLNEEGGKPVANLVSEFFRTVAPKSVFRQRGGSASSYCSYWASERALYENPIRDVCSPDIWVKTILSLLTEE